jgi:hypothetical protein
MVKATLNKGGALILDSEVRKAQTYGTLPMVRQEFNGILSS